MEEVIEVQALVKGLVQGVGFRATARHLAQKQGLKGSVRNLSGGNVEIFAQGGKHALERFFAGLMENFSDYIQVIEQTPIPLKEHDGFQILR